RQAIASRELARSNSFRIHDARVFIGDGRVIDRADVYLKNGKIVDVVEEGQTPADSPSYYSTIEAAGKTLLPGLIDVHTHFGAPGVVLSENLESELAAASYLYSGVTAAKSVGDGTDDLLKLKHRLASGEMLGTEVFMTGPL